MMSLKAWSCAESVHVEHFDAATLRSFLQLRRSYIEASSDKCLEFPGTCREKHFTSLSSNTSTASDLILFMLLHNERGTYLEVYTSTIHV